MQNLTQSNFRARWGESPAVVNRIQKLIKMTQWEPITDDDGINIIGWKNRNSGEISLGVKKPYYEN